MTPKDKTYWERKIRLFLHDPFDKVLKIPGHEARAQRIAEALGEVSLDKSETWLADILAAGLDRAHLPGYSTDATRNGAIDFAKDMCITHPISGGRLPIAGPVKDAETVTREVIALIEADTNRLDRVWSKSQQFLYLFFVLRRRLAAQNCGGLGHLWHRLPADSRIPDHSIWNHAGMVSALGSSLAASPAGKASLLVFSVTPVQPFIAKARKLRDYWTASVILSWLCCEGIVAVMEALGPDHILYPSLQDQPLITAWLRRKMGDGLDGDLADAHSNPNSGVASLPNRFVCIVPAGEEAALAAAIEARIRQEWQQLAERVRDWLRADGAATRDIFTRQINHYWRFGWSSAQLVELPHQEDVAALLGADRFADLFETVTRFSQNYPKANIVYSATHSLAQAALAASKTRPVAVRPPEPGIKCPVCGEYEILHNHAPAQDQDQDQDQAQAVTYGGYKAAADDFWRSQSKRFGASTLRSGEYLCGICAIKRLTPLALKAGDDYHPLQAVFKEGRFPSTTEMATWEFRRQLKAAGLLSDRQAEEELIEMLHETDSEHSPPVRRLLADARRHNISLSETDTYYAILMMDGDKMGDLVNGSTIPARWRDVLHPELTKRYDDGVLRDKAALWADYLDRRRMLAPALHAALSESLGAFSLYAVPHIIHACGGRLIYAGGDDVAAVLPLSTALEAATRLQEAYNTAFVTLRDGAVIPAASPHPAHAPLMLFPGSGEGVSISGGLLLCHHKQPLRGALEEAGALLKQTAKQEMGRNALALRLKKRSGQPRTFAANWPALNPFNPDGSTILASFQALQAAYTAGTLSGSLLYRLPELEVMVTALLPASETVSPDVRARLLDVLAYEVDHSGAFQSGFSGASNATARRAAALHLAAHLAGVSLRWNAEAGKSGAWIFNGEAAIIARYLARGGTNE